MPTQIEALKKASEALTERVRKLENYWYVTLALAAILGIGGAFLGNSLSDAKSQISQLNVEVADASRGLTGAKELAVREISSARTEAIASVGGSVDASLAQARERTVALWLAEERQQREVRDTKQAKWIKFIYAQAGANLPTSNGANGWWQYSILKQSSLVQQELP